MNELITPELSQLPALPTNEIKEGVDAIGGYIGILSAAKRATADQTTINKVDEQIRQYSALRLRWQMELGRRTAKFEGRPGERTDLSQPLGEVMTRAEQLHSLGISTQRASENERMAKASEAVEEYIELSIEQNEVPTTSGALKAIQEAKKPHVTINSHDDEWYTPAVYIEAAREVMGSIDLDPASNDFANETVKAAVYYDEAMNGLEREWYGNIWLNPPYSSALIQQFAEKLAESVFEQAIVLVNNATETGWFRTLIEDADAVVFPTGRIKYRKRDGEHGTPLQGQAFIYFGDSPGRFLKVFSEFGWGARL